MPKRTDIHKILVIGSGPIIIGQAAEFDYSGTQACLALREEGYEVVLVNSNPATIMTDKEIADKVYIEPLTTEFVSQILRKELPDAILPTIGGQIGLNLAMELANSGILDELHIELLGTKLSAIDQAEDRELFKNLMQKLHQPIPESAIAHNFDEAKAFAEKKSAIRSSSGRPSPWAVPVAALPKPRTSCVPSRKMAQPQPSDPGAGRAVDRRLQGNRI